MATNADPWRTLGLAPGATQDEIRRAYRRLAKLNHPDAAGDAALPRFVRFTERYGFRGALFETLLVNPRVVELLVKLFDARGRAAFQSP